MTLRISLKIAMIGSYPTGATHKASVNFGQHMRSV
jgi:hypothetical protein